MRSSLSGSGLGPTPIVKSWNWSSNKAKRSGEVMTRAAAAWNVEVPEDWAGPIAFVGFYRPEDEERFHGWQSSITLVDEHGRAIWNNYWKDVRYGDLLRAADAGVLEGDPLRPYLILHAEIGNGLLADWGTVLNLWDLAWHVFDRIDTLMGVGAAALGARELIRRLKDRLSRGRSVVSKHYVDWRERQATRPRWPRFSRGRHGRRRRWPACSDVLNRRRRQCSGRSAFRAMRPLGSMTLPPRASTASRARSANFRARRAAASSPRSRVNVE